MPSQPVIENIYYFSDNSLKQETKAIQVTGSIKPFKLRLIEPEIDFKVLQLALIYLVSLIFTSATLSPK